MPLRWQISTRSATCGGAISTGTKRVMLALTMSDHTGSTMRFENAPG